MLGTTIDEAYDIPTERTQHLALRSQQIVALESGVCATVDPLGGSYYVEALTDAFEKAGHTEYERVGGPEGVVDAVLGGEPQAELANRAYDVAREIDEGVRLRVGDNIYPPVDAAPEIALHEPDLDLHERRTRELAELRRDRDAAAVDDALMTVRRAAIREVNILPSLIGAAEAYATIGEIAAVLDDVYGRYKEPSSL
jgi:methylmalonyl-CoA mutase N-terminal domain/subunit